MLGRFFNNKSDIKKNKKTKKYCKINKNKSKRFKKTYKIKDFKKYCDKTN